MILSNHSSGLDSDKIVCYNLKTILLDWNYDKAHHPQKKALNKVYTAKLYLWNRMIFHETDEK